MKPASREILLGLLFSILSTAMVFGSSSLALVENQSTPNASIVQSPPANLVPIMAEESSIPQTHELPSNEELPLEASPSPARCAAPQSWVPYVIQNGDSLEMLATAINVTAQMLKDANCLVSDTLIPGSSIFLPAPIPSVTSTLAATLVNMQCSIPPNWIEHILQPDENLLTLSQKYHIRIADLIIANCFQNATVLRAGDTIYLPYPEIATPTPHIDTVTIASTIQPNQSIVTPTSIQSGNVVSETTH